MGIDKLISIGSPSISKDPYLGPDSLYPLYAGRNGFYAFESSLLVRPWTNEAAPLGILEWNRSATWRQLFDNCPNGTFFAETIFGEQFFVDEAGEQIGKFDPEDSSFEMIAENVEDWAAKILADYNYMLGYPLAHEWQTKFGALAPGQKLTPKIAFVLGGDFSLENLVLCEEKNIMKIRSPIANEIVNLPDGASISIRWDS